MSHVPAVHTIVENVIPTDSTTPVLTSVLQEVQASNGTLISPLHIDKTIPTEAIFQSYTKKAATIFYTSLTGQVDRTLLIICQSHYHWCQEHTHIKETISTIPTNSPSAINKYMTSTAYGPMYCQGIITTSSVVQPALRCQSHYNELAISTATIGQLILPSPTGFLLSITSCYCYLRPPVTYGIHTLYILYI